MSSQSGTDVLSQHPDGDRVGSSSALPAEDEENEIELRQLVTQILENNGVLSRLRAQLRASVFLALDDCHPVKRDSDVQPSTPVDGCCAALVRDWLISRRLDYTLSVLEAELGSGGEDRCDGRGKIGRAEDTSVCVKLSPSSSVETPPSSSQTPAAVSQSIQSLAAPSASADGHQLARFLGLSVTENPKKEVDGATCQKSLSVLESLVRHQLSSSVTAPVAESSTPTTTSGVTLPSVRPRRLAPLSGSSDSPTKQTHSGHKPPTENVLGKTNDLSNSVPAAEPGQDAGSRSGSAAGSDAQSSSPSLSSPLSNAAASVDDEDSFFDSLPRVKAVHGAPDQCSGNKTFSFPLPASRNAEVCQQLKSDGVPAAPEDHDREDRSDTSIAEELDEVPEDSASASLSDHLPDFTSHHLDVASV